MPLDDDLNRFKSWSMQLGCPPQSIPSDKTLIKLFSCGQSLAFQNVLNKVRPCNTVREIRQNILINSMKYHKGSLISMATKSTLPTEAQRFIKVNRLKTKINETEKRNENTNGEIEKLQKIVQEKSSQIAHSKCRLNSSQARRSIFYLKNKCLRKKVAEEQETMANIKQIMPVPFNADAVRVSLANQAIVQCTEELQKLYKMQDENLDCQTYENETFWQNMRTIFANIPNHLLWTELNRYKDDHLQNATNLTNLHSSETMNSKSKISAFSTALHKAHIKNIALHIDLKSLTEKQDEFKQMYCPLYAAFANDFETKMNVYNHMQIDTELMTEFMIKLSMFTYSTGEIDYLKAELDRREKLVASQNIDLADFHLVIASVKQKYEEIETTFLNARNEIELLHLIKEKILHCVKTTKHLIRETNHVDGQLALGQNSIEIILSSSTLNSFNSLSESVLCSTKLDVVNTTLRRENQTVKHVLPQFVNEISLLMDVPVAQLNKISAENQLMLCNGIDFNQLPLPMAPSMAHHIFGYFPFGRAMLNDIRCMATFYSQFHNLPKLNVSFNLPAVDEKHLKQLQRDQHNQMEELIDQIDVLCTTTNRSIEHTKKYYDFLVKNPLRQYVPKTILFNGRSFDEYEQEYLMYYTILNSHNSRH